MQAATSVETPIDGFCLEANGVNVSRATYAALQTKLSGLSYPFGSGDGSTTMGLPDLSGRSATMMAASGHADVNGLGDSDGLAKASRTPKAAAHTHSESAHTHSTPAHSHGMTAGTVTVTNPGVGAGGGATPVGSPGTYNVVGNTATEGAGTTGSGGSGTTGSGGGTSGNYLVVGVLAVKYRPTIF